MSKESQWNTEYLVVNQASIECPHILSSAHPAHVSSLARLAMLNHICFAVFSLILVMFDLPFVDLRVVY